MGKIEITDAMIDAELAGEHVTTPAGEVRVSLSLTQLAVGVFLGNLMTAGLGLLIFAVILLLNNAS